MTLNMWVGLMLPKRNGAEIHPVINLYAMRFLIVHGWKNRFDSQNNSTGGGSDAFARGYHKMRQRNDHSISPIMELIIL